MPKVSLRRGKIGPADVALVSHDLPTTSIARHVLTFSLSLSRNFLGYGSRLRTLTKNRPNQFVSCSGCPISLKELTGLALQFLDSLPDWQKKRPKGFIG